MSARKVTVWTGDHGDVTIPEPAWCLAKHEDEGYRQDIEHRGADVPAVIQTPCHGAVSTLVASLVQRPFSLQDTRTLVSLDLGDDWHELAAPDLDAAAAVLVEHAAKLRCLARDLRVMDR
ncbi:hypothetical protein AB0C77_23375 [Streptomyces sp. NPDC048629]|uniref:DUF6907 domain-containing protein n=1 Tax=Streptomyces sp. NPDC048629 TaxID=3154824 RepID=UPI0034314CF2